MFVFRDTVYARNRVLTKLVLKPADEPSAVEHGVTRDASIVDDVLSINWK